MFVFPVERRSIRQPRAIKRGGQHLSREGPVDVTPEEPCRTEVRTALKLTLAKLCVYNNIKT